MFYAFDWNAKCSCFYVLINPDVTFQVTDSSFENKEGASFSVTQAGEPPAVEPEELGKQDGKPEPKTNTNNEPPETETVLVSQNKTEDIQEPPPPPECVTLLAEEPSTSQSYDNPASSVQRPEDVLARCEDNLLKHIDSMQDTIEEQLDLIENQVTGDLVVVTWLYVTKWGTIDDTGSSIVPVWAIDVA